MEEGKKKRESKETCSCSRVSDVYRQNGVRPASVAVT